MRRSRRGGGLFSTILITGTVYTYWEYLDYAIVVILAVGTHYLRLDVRGDLVFYYVLPLWYSLYPIPPVASQQRQK